MPLLSTFATASLRNFGFAGDTTIRYVTGLFPSSGGTSAALNTLGVLQGDFALFGSLNNPTVTSAGGAWTSIGSDGAFRYSYRQLNATDVASSISYGADCVIMIWRGGVASAAQRGSAAYGGSNPVALAGFVKASNHAGIAAFAYARDGAVGTPAITTPATFTTRGSETIVSGSTYKSVGYDRLSPPQITYINSTAFSATFNSAAGIYTILELLR